MRSNAGLGGSGAAETRAEQGAAGEIRCAHGCAAPVSARFLVTPPPSYACCKRSLSPKADSGDLNNQHLIQRLATSSIWAIEEGHWGRVDLALGGVSDSPARFGREVELFLLSCRAP